MRNPTALFNNLREMYLRYLDSPFDLRYPDLVRERRSLPAIKTAHLPRSPHRGSPRLREMSGRLCEDCEGGPRAPLDTRTDR